MLDFSISKKAQLRFNLNAPLPLVKGDATQIRQVIMNLVINASEAIGDQSGVITITTGSIDCTEAYLTDCPFADPVPPGKYVILEIADTGCGMDTDTVNKIFDPFFTTKFTGRGLGMAAVLGIIRGHKGAIRIESVPGTGSCFWVLLPAAAFATEPVTDRIDSHDWCSSGVVLLVDDEEDVRAIGADMLRELGFEVVTAGNGSEALERFTSRNDICGVILDLTMPQLRQLKPDIKVMISSGYSEQEVIKKFTGEGVVGFIQKPYTLAELTGKIRNCFGNN
jgi:CheY-like chemotaxis protein